MLHQLCCPPQSEKDIFRFISLIDKGRKVLSDFFLASQESRITLHSYPPELREKLIEHRETPSSLQGATRPPTPLGAFFTTDGVQGKIYFDSQGELGILVLFLFHEIVHSLDESLWAAARQKQSASSRRNLVFESECRAFRAQYELQTALMTEYPDFRTYYTTRYTHIPFLRRALLPDEIAELYALSG